MEIIKTRKVISLIAILTISTFGCISEQEVLPDDCSTPPVLSLVSTTEADCNQNNGGLIVIGTQGIGLLNYSLDDGPSQRSPIFEGIRAGRYTVTVVDENGCSSTLDVDIFNKDGLNLEFSTTETVCGENRGAITVNAIGATGVVEYRLNNGVFQGSNEFLNLAQGGYTVTARDESGCEVNQEINVKADVVFGEIELIIRENCVTSVCHTGVTTPDYRTASDIIGNASLIKLRTANRSMPPDGATITQAQINAIACWVDDGASGN